MPELGFQDSRSGLGFSRSVRDVSPDSVIYTGDSNFSIFSSASGSVDRCSFASDAHDQDSSVSDVSQVLFQLRFLSFFLLFTVSYLFGSQHLRVFSAIPLRCNIKVKTNFSFRKLKLNQSFIQISSCIISQFWIIKITDEVERKCFYGERTNISLYWKLKKN